MNCFLGHSLHDLSNDAATFAIYAITRLLRCPPPEIMRRKNIPEFYSKRIQCLINGKASELWNDYDWLSHLPTPVDFHHVSSAKVAQDMARSIQPSSPSAAFRRLTSAPFFPPTEPANQILLTLFQQSPNPDFDSLREAARQFLPKGESLGSGFLPHDDERKR